MSFDVLSSKTNILGAHFLEASAGTGKTFSIEHLYVRFIIEHNIEIKEILVVTFTRMATQEIENRIYLNLKFISDHLFQDELLPNYVLQLKQNLDVKEIYNRLNNALNNFHHHGISTIHGFCQKILNKYLPGQILNDEKNYRIAYLLKEIRSYLTQEQFKKFIKENRLKIISQKYATSYGFKVSLEEALLKEILSKNFLPEHDPYKTTHELHDIFKKIKNQFPNFTSEDIFDNLSCDASLFKGTFSRSNEMKDKFKRSLEKFCDALFEGELGTLQDDEICLLSDISKLKKNKTINDLSDICQTLIRTQVFEKILQFFNPQTIMAMLCRDIKEYLQKKDLLLTENDLLTITKDLIEKNPTTAEKIRNNFSCIMIDEFQDTDSIQWDIFSNLYVSSDEKKNIFLIGDPKQSIYRFRNSDVYIYNEARKQFQTEGTFAYLDTNYRSTLSLINTLNFFFQSAAHLMTLPKEGTHIEYYPLKTPKNNNQSLNNSCYIITEATEELIFKKICSKVLFLNKNEKIPYKNMAVLFKDRKQMYSFSKISTIPTTIHSNRKLAESLVIEILIAILESIASPYNEEKLYKALLTPIFSLDFQEIEAKKNDYIKKFNSYGVTLKNQGILSFFEEIMKDFGSNFIHNVHHSLYHDLETLCEILNRKTSIATHYLLELELMKQSKYYESESEYLLKDSQFDALQLITIHASKGLEYDVIFTPGLDKINRHTSDKSDSEQLEEKSEQIRQVYVALTRAKSYLFITLTTNSYSSIETGKPKTPISRFLQEITQRNGLSLKELALKDNPPFLFDNQEEVCKHFSNENSPLLIKPLSFDINIDKDKKIQSFSSYKAELHKKNYFLADDNNKKTPFKNAILPIGPQTGGIIHKILEKLDFEIFNTINIPEELIPYILRFTKYSILEGYEKVIADILDNAFNTLIKFDDQKFMLKEISSKKIFKEENFHLFHNLFSFNQNKYWKGCIDVFFEHNGYYYIIDWKTTYIGPDYEDYNSESLLTTLYNNLLDKQAEIYKAACLKYLKNFKKEKFFKGVIFIFLRGCNKKGEGIITL